MHSHSDYVSLHLHTEYSLLDGAIKIKDLIAKAKEFKMPAIAMTDHGNLFGAVDFYKQCTHEGIKPIIGCEMYVAPKSRHEKGGGFDNDEQSFFHLILLARDNLGYRNLLTLVSKSYIEGFYYKPRIDMELLEEYAEGLIGLSACLKGEVPHYLSRGMLDKARERALAYRQIFGAENYFFEIQANGLPEQENVNRQLIELGMDLHIGVVATNDCHYLRREDAKAHEVLLCIQTGKTMKDKSRMKFSSNEFYLKSPQEMAEKFRDVPEAIRNTILIAERCNVEITHKNLLPQFKPEGGESPLEMLSRLANEGLRRKIGADAPKEYKDRLQSELEMIKHMGFTSYFLIVWDFIHYAKVHNIPVGPGRGSAAGSLVSYCLDITEIDPIKYKLLFERFLNPERISMPDIDVDFCQDRRQEVIQYVAQKYGADHVAQIITFGTMKAKAAIRDVGRALDMPYADVDRIAKLIPNDLGITIGEALKMEPQLKQAYETDAAVCELLDIATRLEGLNRHASTHAAGVVISPEPLTNYAPLYRNSSDESIVTQYEMKALEKIGLLKFDFLGLKTLTVIQKTLDYIKQNKETVDISTIPLDDPFTYELLCSGQTAGVFQLESEGMRDILIRMQPNRFEDLIALVALYRPGPMQWIDDFIKRKKGINEVKYMMPQLKEILDETYGIILYQEQVMLIANKIANFSMGQADVLRKAMGKKNVEEMERQKEIFIKGAVANNISEKKAARLFEMMEPFALYGFNKSHSAAYAFIAYQTAYLKAHYPVEFMAATLSLDMSDTDKIVKSINECRKMQIEMLPPDINLSGREFRVIGNSIRFGLEAVKGVGGAAIESLIDIREKDGDFASVHDLVQRVDNRKVNKKVLESLVKAGAFDSLGINRASAMNAVAEALNAAGSRNTAQVSMFADEPDVAETVLPEWEEYELLKNEKDALGFYITGHPLTKYNDILLKMKAIKTGELGNVSDKAEVITGGIIRAVRKKNVKSSGELMAYITLEDDEGSVEAIVFPNLYKTAFELLVKDEVVYIRGNIDKDEKGVRIKTTEISRLDDVVKPGVVKIEISIPHAAESIQNLHNIRSIVLSNPGDCRLYLRIVSEDSQAVIESGFGIKADDLLMHRLETIVGRGALTVI